MNPIFSGIVLVAVAYAVISGFDATTLGWSHEPVKAVGDAALASAKTSVELAIGLVGYIALFLGLMEIVKEAGGLDFMARLIRPVLVRLFPDVPADHPAMGAIVMNLAANVLGLGNAATPFGLKAMQELQKLNDEEGTATNAMVLFLAINTSGVAVLPTGVIGLRAKLGSVDPAAIFPTTLLATACSTITAVIVVKLLQRLPMFQRKTTIYERPPASSAEFVPFAIAVVCILGLVAGVYTYGEKASSLIIPGLIAGMVGIGVVRRVKVYEVFVRGAKDGFTMALTIIPYLVAILVAVGMLRASGALDLIVRIVAPVTNLIGLPGEVLPLALLRPLSGSGAFALTAEIVEKYGPDTFIGQLASTLNGSMETTFYVLAVYFGSVGISRSRHAVPAGLAADLAGVIGSVIAVRLLLGS